MDWLLAASGGGSLQMLQNEGEVFSGLRAATDMRSFAPTGA